MLHNNKKKIINNQILSIYHETEMFNMQKIVSNYTLNICF